MNPEIKSKLKEGRPHGTSSFPCGIYRTQSAQKGMIVKHHWHEEIEMIHFLKGHFRLLVNMESYEIQEECIYFINPGELHGIISESKSYHEEHAIVFQPGILSFETYDSAQMYLINPLRNQELSFPRCLQPDHPSYASILACFTSVTDFFGEEELPVMEGGTAEAVISQLHIKASLLKMLAILFQFHLYSDSHRNTDARVELIKASMIFIRNHYREKIYIRDLASLANMNEQYFCRFFKKALGRTPTEYINDYRIRKAISLLETTDLPVMNICLDSGFFNLGNFLKIFRRYTGTTPLQYRKEKSK
ncbi:helix-turn-helix transcriptional regulator [Lacrimispora saccharolytica]|uniref:Transcriptional regulator, AraC family n=1 Tax=Lacrimispora saccharolytica (strain ATCC 35040 / DSM 2544 / NRCC 2533 / WM1) TaxID=610130 RepID=D9R6R4_LACSW|nr:AraC family transcriptional regulator [Lacrimispora saccharolytica]ADL03570.1 transcriptional regulator, AraC family [[Clostridium] saccharolyticum WM1]QRV18285.1 helix-turn-helix transcriptional regulator [Lacrimispora saccharolytica]